VLPGGDGHQLSVCGSECRPAAVPVYAVSDPSQRADLWRQLDAQGSNRGIAIYMTAPYIRRPWRSQPPGMAVADPDSIFYPGIESVFLGSLTAGEVNGITTTQVPNLAASNSWGGNGVPVASSTAYGFGPLLASTIEYSIG